MKAMLYTTDQQHSLLESYNNNSNQVQEKISFGTFVAGRHFTIRFYCLLSIFSLLILSQVFSMQSLGEHVVVPGWKPSYEWGLHCCLPMSAEIRQFNLFKDPLWRQDSRDLQKKHFDSPWHSRPTSILWSQFRQWSLGQSPKKALTHYNDLRGMGEWDNNPAVLSFRFLMNIMGYFAINKA